MRRVPLPAVLQAQECPAGCDLDLEVTGEQWTGMRMPVQELHNSQSLKDYLFLAALDHIHTKPIPEACSDVSCRGLNCTVGEDRSGCPFCNCKAPCPPPVCQEGCQVEKETTEPGRCPGCACKLSRSIRGNVGICCVDVLSANKLDLFWISFLANNCKLQRYC
ncbi:uncharacterized protein CEXT_335961 [Caerostris extrusa]|uniref:Uncharacterized protein n=1 Tax=Caerostris extrusa TaxID=172846 RepID=A0AAV4TYL9_CAEEX|nr:uncharacterized protein CEXT_335961 [Caerostris extrusa]